MIIELPDSDLSWRDRWSITTRNNSKTVYLMWEDAEVQTLIALNNGGGMTQPQIAMALNRTYAAVQGKLRELRRQGMIA